MLKRKDLLDFYIEEMDREKMSLLGDYAVEEWVNYIDGRDLHGLEQAFLLQRFFLKELKIESFRN